MPESAKLVVVIPVGPYCVPQYIADTIDSIRYYTDASRRIILVDDSGSGRAGEFAGDEVGVIQTPTVQGHGGGLYASLSLAFKHALRRYEFPVLLRMDTDALIIGARPEEDATRFLMEHPQVGLLGRHVRPRDNNTPGPTAWWPVQQIKFELSFQQARRYTRRWRSLRRLLQRALDHGYEMGESVFGGAYFISAACIGRLEQAGLLPEPNLCQSWLEEDHLFSMAVRALGMELAEFSIPGQPMGMHRLQLVASPEDLLAQGRKVIHSTRSWADMDEDAIRTYFRQFRGPRALGLSPRANPSEASGSLA